MEIGERSSRISQRRGPEWVAYPAVGQQNQWGITWSKLESTYGITVQHSSLANILACIWLSPQGLECS